MRTDRSSSTPYRSRTRHPIGASIGIHIDRLVKIQLTMGPNAYLFGLGINPFMKCVKVLIKSLRSPP